MFDQINLDGFATAEEMNEVAKTLETLAQYAKAKALAMKARADGYIKIALTHEKTCDAIYSTLPSWAQW